MNYRMLKTPVVILAVFSLVVFFSNTASAGGSFTIKWGKDQESEPQQVKPKKKKGGPPAHAPAHGYRAKHQYRYYPDGKVYHDTQRGIYFYLKGDSWEAGVSLPGELKVGLGDYVSLELDTETPYIHNDEHVKKYPPGQLKKNKKLVKN